MADHHLLAILLLMCMGTLGRTIAFFIILYKLLTI